MTIWATNTLRFCKKSTYTMSSKPSGKRVVPEKHSRYIIKCLVGARMLLHLLLAVLPLVKKCAAITDIVDNGGSGET